MQNTSSRPIFSFFPQIARFYSFASLPPTPALALIYLESDLPFSLVLTDFDNNIMVCHRESGGNRGGGCCLIPQPVTVALCGLTPSTVIPNCSKLSSGTHNLADKYWFEQSNTVRSDRTNVTVSVLRTTWVRVEKKKENLNVSFHREVLHTAASCRMFISDDRFVWGCFQMTHQSFYLKAPFGHHSSMMDRAMQPGLIKCIWTCWCRRFQKVLLLCSITTHLMKSWWRCILCRTTFSAPSFHFFSLSFPLFDNGML